MKKRPSTTEAKRPPELDPILPLPAGSGIPYLRNGDGTEILNDATPVVIETTYRGAYIMWEIAESLAKRHYQREIDGPFANHANAILEAVYGLRNRQHETIYGRPLPKMSEERARKARKALAEIKAQEAKSAKTAAKGRRGAQNAQDEGSGTNPATSTAPAKTKTRCVAKNEGERCTGPAKHNGRHKDRHGNRWL